LQQVTQFFHGPETRQPRCAGSYVEGVEGLKVRVALNVHGKTKCGGRVPQRVQVYRKPNDYDDRMASPYQRAIVCTL
jgi:hypothetical protein